MKDVVYLISLVILVIPGTSGSSVLDNLHYVGCYDVGYPLMQNYGLYITPTTLTKCVQHCLGLKARFAGVEASENACYCGPDIDEESTKRDDSLCNVKCFDEPLRTCGGDWMLSLYEVMGTIHTADFDTEADFLLALSNGVRISSSGGISSTVVTTTDWVYSVDYHMSRDLLFFHSNTNIYVTDLQPRGKTILDSKLVKNVTTCEGFAVDWVNDRIIWANCDRNRTYIMTAGLDGEGEKSLLLNSELYGKQIKRMEIDPYRRMIFWIANGVVQSLHLDEGIFNPNLTRAEVAVRAIALDRRMRRVYYVGTINNSSLYSVDYSGGDEVEHFSIIQLRSVYGLTVVGDMVFWVNYANVKDILYVAPINFTRGGSLKLIQSIDRAVWHMKAMHPSLQTQPKVHPCQNKNCSYDCGIKRKNAYCKCPLGYELNDDGITCHETKWESLPVRFRSKELALSCLLVVAVLLAALVLVYISDKYWRLLESKLFDVPYSRNRGKEDQDVSIPTGTSEYHIGEDTVNLI